MQQFKDSWGFKHELDDDAKCRVYNELKTAYEELTRQYRALVTATLNYPN